MNTKPEPKPKPKPIPRTISQSSLGTKNNVTRSASTRSRSRSANIASLAQSKDLLKSENDTLKLQLSSLDLEINLLKEDIDRLKNVTPVKSVEYYVLKIKNKKNAEEIIKIENDIKILDFEINNHLKGEGTFHGMFQRKMPINIDRIMGSLSYYKKKLDDKTDYLYYDIDEKERSRLLKKIHIAMNKLDPDRLWVDPRSDNRGR